MPEQLVVNSAPETPKKAGNKLKWLSEMRYTNISVSLIHFFLFCRAHIMINIEEHNVLRKKCYGKKHFPKGYQYVQNASYEHSSEKYNLWKNLCGAQISEQRAVTTGKTGFTLDKLTTVEEYTYKITFGMSIWSRNQKSESTPRKGQLTGANILDRVSQG